MPETTRSGSPLKTCVTAMFTQSVGVPSTANTRSAMRSSRSGCRSVSAWPIALASVTGATIVTSPSGSQRLGQRLDALRAVPIVIGDENASHLQQLTGFQLSAVSYQLPLSVGDASLTVRRRLTLILAPPE